MYRNHFPIICKSRAWIVPLKIFVIVFHLPGMINCSPGMKPMFKFNISQLPLPQPNCLDYIPARKKSRAGQHVDLNYSFTSEKCFITQGGK